MKHEIYELNKYYNVKGGTLTSYVQKFPFDSVNNGWTRPTVVIVPGGNYYNCSEREAEPVAYKFLSLGFNCFILRYLNQPEGVHYPEQLIELACSLDFINKNLSEFNATKDEIFVVGFSAGGHLAGSLSTDYTLAIKEYGNNLDCKIQAAGLIYPVISDLYGFTGTHENLFYSMNEENINKINHMRLDEMVGDNTVPTFIACTQGDDLVPSLNSIKYAEALAKKKITYELHIYKDGIHGLSTFDKYINPVMNEMGVDIKRGRRWVYDCADFFRSYTKELF